MGNRNSVEISSKDYNLPCIDENFHSVSDFNSFAHCVKKVKGAAHATNDSSPYDLYEVELKNGKHLLIKIFVTEIPSDLVPFFGQDTLKLKFFHFTFPMYYAYMVQVNRILPLINERICPFFVRVKGGDLHYNITSFVNLLMGRLQTTNSNSVTDINMIMAVLKRNFSYLFHSAVGNAIINEIPSISDMNTTIHQSYSLSNKQLKALRLGTIITETFTSFTSFGKFILDTLTECLKDKHNFKINMQNIFRSTVGQSIFQLAIACKAMQLVTVRHNRLNENNIYVQLYPSSQTHCYFIETKNSIKPLIAQSKFILKIDNFERSFVYGNRIDTALARLDEQFPIQPNNHSTNKFPSYYFPQLMNQNKEPIYDFLQSIKIIFDCANLVANNKDTKEIFNNLLNEICSCIMKSDTTRIAVISVSQQSHEIIDNKNRVELMKSLLNKLFSTTNSFYAFSSLVVDDAMFFNIDEIIEKLHDKFVKPNTTDHHPFQSVVERFYICNSLFNQHGVFITDEKDNLVAKVLNKLPSDNTVQNLQNELVHLKSLLNTAQYQNKNIQYNNTLTVDDINKLMLEIISKQQRSTSQTEKQQLQQQIQNLQKQKEEILKKQKSINLNPRPVFTYLNQNPISNTISNTISTSNTGILDSLIKK